MKHSHFSRALSLVLALVMVFSMFPVRVFASDSAVCTQISSADELTTGKYVMVVATGYAPTVLDGTWVQTEKIAVENGTVSAPANMVWDITVEGSTVKLTDSNGVTIAPKGGNNNGIKAADYDWAWSFDAATKTFVFAGQGSDTVKLASNANEDPNYGGFHRFRGYKNTTIAGNPDTYPCNFTLYKLGEGSGETPVPSEPVPSEPVPSEPAGDPAVYMTEAPSNGDTILIYNAANTAVLGSANDGKRQAGVTAEAIDGQIALTDEMAQLLVTIDDDGSYIFSLDGLYLTSGETGNSLSFQSELTDCGKWQLQLLENGSYILMNVGANYNGNYNQAMEYYKGFTTYGVKTTDIYMMDFYLVEAAPVPEEPVADDAIHMTEAPANGDTILIYNAANTAVLGSANDGKRQAGVTAEAIDGRIALTDEMAQLLVTIDDAGNYIFSLDGLYLTSGETGNSLSFQSELTDCGKWTLEAQESGSYILMNVGANYNGNYNQAMEYYKGFTTYGVKTTDIYMMDFYLVKAGSKQSCIVTELHEGDNVVIFNPANSMALSTEYTGFYNKGTSVVLADGVLTGFTAADIWTVGVNDDGSYTFSTAAGQKLSMGTGYSSMPLDDVNTAWVLENAKTENCFYIMNKARGNYIEWYADKNNWSSYYNNSNEELFAQMFYLVGDEASEPETGLPGEGKEVVIFNLSSQGVLGAENDTQSIENVTGYVEGDTFVADNGAVIFTVSRNGEYYRFYNETYGYLCSGGTGNNAFYSREASDDADWLLQEGKSGGFFLESRTAKFNGKYSQFLEYYSDSYKTYSMNNVTDYDIYEFFFYELNTDFTMGSVVGGLVNYPQIFLSENAPVKGQDWVVTFTVDALFGLEGDIQILVYADPTGDGSESYPVENAFTLAGPDVTGTYTVTVPADIIDSCGAGITLDITATDTMGNAFGNMIAAEIIDEPSIIDITPAANAQTLDNKRPTISAKLVNVGENAVATMTVNGQTVEAVYENGVITYTPAADMADGRTTVTITVTRADGKTAEKSWSFYVGEKQYEMLFGQLHSHTTYSDGSGSLQSALAYIGSLPESANVDFVAFTDHSNYFDTSSAVNPEGALYDMTLAGASSQELWNTYKGDIAAFNASQQNVVAIGGFEMTWSGGPGHINTFNTPGIVSRNNSTLNSKTADAGMKAYYSLLSRTEGLDSISQLNHPGTTFGNFSDFAYWDPVIDSRVFLVEVGNGEGQVGSGGYFPSYEQYTMALDKGWHLAPTNNQDNHKGKWGNANEARDVVLADSLTEEAIYEAIRAYRVYATEDKNLEIGYTVNGYPLGSIFSEIPETLNVEVSLYDPDASDSISKVEVIVNSGKVAYTWDDPAQLSIGTLSAELAPDYSYYYLRVTQGDGDIAVTAPVWVGETLKLGISNAECGTSTPVTGEELTISTTLFNSESGVASVKSLTYSIGSQVLAVDNTGYTIPASGNLTVDYKYIPEAAKVMTITVTAVVALEDVEYTFSMDVKLDVQDASKLVYIGIDASHYNEYVAGNYKDSMGNFGALAAGYSVRTVELKTSEDLIAACGNDKYAALVLTAPSRRLAAAQAELRTYTDDEIAAIVAFNQAGGTVILAGWSDNYENYDAVAGMLPEQHMAGTQNALLEALGSSLRITDDATHDNELNGGQSQRLYFNAFNFDSFLMEGVEVDPENPNDRLYTEVYSQYGGATIHAVDAEGNMTSVLPGTVTPIVFGHTSTYSKDSDNDGIGGDSVPKYAYAENDDRLLVLASEQLEGHGLIIVSGAAFMSNFEVQATIEDSGSEKNYSNYKICENLVAYLNPATITPIAEVQSQTEEGIKYTIEGVITSNASGFDKDTAFFDCVYLQDGTAGINAFPVAGNYRVGDKVRITGTTSSYQGERQIAVTSIELIGEGFEVKPTVITASELNDGSVLGSLVTLKGTVESFEYANGLVQTIMVRDAAGNLGRVFIDGYITTAKDVQNLTVGAYVVVTGLASYDNSFDGPAPRIRVRNRADVVVTANPDSFKDVTADHWFYDAVRAVVEAGIMNGKDGTTFDPEGNLTRAEWVTMLYRSQGCPAVAEPCSFTDVPADAFYADAFAWAEDLGIVSGVGGGMGAPDLEINREQMVTMLYRFDGSNHLKHDLSSFTDVEDISYFAFDAFEWAVGNGYVNGMTATVLAPLSTTTRAQAATILARYLGLI